MNNGFLQDDEVVIDTTVVLRERQVKVIKIIEAINALSSREEWRVLKDLIFDGALKRVEDSLQTESRKDELFVPTIYRLQGELKWAKKYSDLYKLAETYKVELESINKKLTKENNENGTI